MSDLSQGQHGQDPNDPDGQAAHNREGAENRLSDKFDKEKQRGDGLERKLALVLAGIDTETDAGEFFANGYDGDLDPKVIQATARKVAPGALKADPAQPAASGQDPNVDPANVDPNNSADPTNPDPGQTPTVPTASPEEAAAVAAANNLAAGAPPDQISQPDPYGQAADIYESELESGGSKRDAAGMAFSKITQSALEGDKRVTVNPQPGL